jgi:hypothetical protein
MIHFYDAASPENVPSGVYAAVYINGDYAWPHDEIARMRKVFRISIEREPSWARIARCIDIENGAGGVEDAAPFIRARLHYGFNDGTVYVNRSNRDEVDRRLRAAGFTALEWVSTLDGTQDIPGAWAVQYQGGMHAAYDLSVLHGVNNFHNPFPK